MDGFFKSLKTVKLENVFNPWFCRDEENDIDSDSPSIRLSQLKQYMLERKKCEVSSGRGGFGVSGWALYRNRDDV